MFLFITTYIACRYLIHATLFSCAACSQKEAGIHGPLTQETSARCIWDDYTAFPALNQDKDEPLGGSTTLRIMRQKGPDLVERFWLNDEEWFQISPRNVVIHFISCLALACFGGGALNPDGIFASVGSHVSKNAAFYITMAFTFGSTCHTPAGDSPELMFVPLKHCLPRWKATARAMIATMLVHVYLVFGTFSEIDLSFVTPLACTIVAPLLLAGISNPLESPRQEGNHGPSVKVYVEPASPTNKPWTIDSTLVYSSSRVRCIDLRVLLLGLSVTFFDVLYNHYQDESSLTRWPISAVIPISVTGVWLYLENSVVPSRELDPGMLSLATTALVGIFNHVNFLDAFRLYDNEWEDENFTHIIPVSENGSHSKPIMIALWYTTLISMVVANRRLVRQRADQALPTTNGQPARKDHLLFGIHVKKSRINFAWQLRNSRVAISLVFTTLASLMGERWPVDMNTTVAGLFLFVLIVSFQIRPRRESLEEKRSLHHLAAFGFSAIMTALAITLNRYGVLHEIVSDPKSDWKAGTWTALVSYQFLIAVFLLLEGRGWFTRRNPIKMLPATEGQQDEEKSAAQEE